MYQAPRSVIKKKIEEAPSLLYKYSRQGREGVGETDN